MPRPRGTIWLGGALLAGTVLATAAEFLFQREQLRASSLGLVASLPIFIRTTFFCLGTFLIWLGWPRRSGHALHCRRCGYRQEDQGRIVSQCPECGAPWRWIGHSRSGQRTAHQWMIASGLLLILLVSGTWLIRRAAPRLMLRWLPDDVLLQQLSAYPDDEVADQWVELDTRSVPMFKLDQLAEALLRKKSRDGYLCKRAESLIFAWITRAPTTQPVARQYLSQVLSATMRGPESIDLGDPLRLRTTAIFRGDTIATQPEPRIVVISALFLGDDAEPAQSWIWPVRAIPGDQPRQLDHVNTPKTPGILAARQVFWLAIGGNPGDEVTMGPSEPILPMGMRIYNTFEVEWSVNVKEPPKKPAP